MNCLPPIISRLKEYFEVPGWYWRVAARDWETVIQIIPATLLACFALFSEHFVSPNYPDTLVLFLVWMVPSSLVLGLCLPPFHRSFVLRALPLSQSQWSCFHWWNPIIIIQLALVTVFGAAAMCPYFSGPSFSELSMPERWNWILRFGAADALAVSVHAGILAAISPVRTHWSFRYIPFARPQRKSDFLAFLPILVAFFSWPYVFNSESFLPKAMFISWGVLATLGSRSLFQAPYCMPESVECMAESRHLRRELTQRIFPIRSSFTKYIVLQWYRSDFRFFVVFAGTMSFSVLFCEAAPAIPRQIVFGIALLGGGFLCRYWVEWPVGLGFSIRELRILPTTGAQFVVAKYLFGGADLVGLLSILMLSSFLPWPWQGNDLLFNYVGMSVVTLGVAGSFVASAYIPVAAKGIVLILFASASTFTWCVAPGHPSLWVVMLFLSLPLGVACFVFDLWAVSHSRAVYFRRSDLKEFGRMEWVDDPE